MVKQIKEIKYKYFYILHELSKNFASKKIIDQIVLVYKI